MAEYYPLALIERESKALGNEYARISATTTNNRTANITKAFNRIDSRLKQLEELKEVIIALGLGQIKEEG